MNAKLLLLAFVARAASWHPSGAIHPASSTPRAQLAAQLRPESPRGLTAEIEALRQRVSALGRTLRGKGPARVSEAEEDDSSWEGQDDPEEAALLRLESDLLAAEAAASDLLLLEDAAEGPEPAVAADVATDQGTAAASPWHPRGRGFLPGPGG